MNLFKYRGFRLVVILIFFIIIGIVVGKKAMKLMEQKKYDDLKTDFLLIQAKVKMIKGKSEVSGNKECYIGTKVSETGNYEIRNKILRLGYC